MAFPNSSVASDVTQAARAVAIDHHDEMASEFEARYRAMSESRFSSAFAYGRHKVDRLLDAEVSRLPRGAKVLDVGCGTGEYLKYLAGRGLEPSGVEPAPAMLDRARSLNPGLNVTGGVITALPFPDAHFDLVMAIEVLRYLHLADTRQGLVEVLRVLKPGGVVFLTMVNRWALDGFFLLQRGRQWLRGGSFDNKHPHCEFFTPNEIRDELARAGFAEIETQGRLFGPVRLAYKAGRRVGAAVAQAIEPVDDRLHERDWATAFAGHLIVTGRRP